MRLRSAGCESLSAEGRGRGGCETELRLDSSEEQSNVQARYDTIRIFLVGPGFVGSKVTSRFSSIPLGDDDQRFLLVLV